MSRPCVRCGGRGEHDHHLTLRDENGDRLDDELVAWLCRVCHLHAHNVLRIVELERAVGPLSGVERVELRLRRVGAFLACLGAPWSVLTDPLSAVMSRWADELAGEARRLDRRSPGWRTDTT